MLRAGAKTDGAAAVASAGPRRLSLVPVSRTLGFALGRNISSSRPDSLGAACRLIRGEALDLFFDQLLGEHRHDFPHHLLDDFA